MRELYEQLGISAEVYDFGRKVEDTLKDRFAEFDRTAEYNQMKVLLAMQKNKVSAECFNSSSGYGYDDFGRDTLEKVYADTFHTEACLVRPQIACGTHALGNRPFRESPAGRRAPCPGGKALRHPGGSDRDPPVQRIHLRNTGSLTVRWI